MQLSTQSKGYIFAIIASASYGTNPLFALPLYDEGMQPLSVLFYRYFFAVIGMLIFIGIERLSLRTTRKEFGLSVIMGTLFALSSLFLFESFNYMDAGIASTILFVYPIMVVLLSHIFFKEPIKASTIFCVTLATLGIVMLYRGADGATLSTIGVVFVLLSSLVYALYIVGVNRSVLKSMSSITLSFYAMVIGLVLWTVILLCTTGIQPLTSLKMASNAIGLALFPTIISVVLVTRAIHMIGSTPASIIGALEPITALIISIIVFGGVLTIMNWVGVVLVLLAVIVVVISSQRK